MTLADHEEYLISTVVDQVIDVEEQEPLIVESTRVWLVAVDRWGRDLERDAGEQRYAAFKSAVEDAAADVRDRATVPILYEMDTLIEGVDKVSELVDMPFEINEPGPIVEPVEEILSVSPLTGIVYAVTDWDEAGDGRIVANSKRELSRDEIDPDQIHGPARQAYEMLGGADR